MTFAGSRRADDVYPRAELLVSPSRYEGLPLVPMEALENGVPVVASDIPPHRELLGRADGSILPADDTQWHTELASLLRDAPARRSLGERQARVRPVDPVGKMWAAYEAIYRAVVWE